MRAVKEKGSEAVDKTRRRLGRSQHDKTCRLHLKVGAAPRLVPSSSAGSCRQLTDAANGQALAQSGHFGQMIHEGSGAGHTQHHKQHVPAHACWVLRSIHVSIHLDDAQSAQGFASVLCSVRT